MAGNRGSWFNVTTWAEIRAIGSGYDISRGTDVNEPLKGYREMVKGAFGALKKVMWWLECTQTMTPAIGG